MYRPGLGELEAVIAIAREGSFRRAALALGMSTTALSNAVAKLETNLGARLFNRTTRSVSLSDAGRAFVEQVSPAVRDIQDAMAGVRSQQQTPSGMLRINAFAAGAREIMSPLVLEFLRLYPDVHVDLVTEGRLVDIVADGFDVGVRRADLVPADMIALPVGRLQRHAVVASPAQKLVELGAVVFSRHTESRKRRRISTRINAFASACRMAPCFVGISRSAARRRKST